MNHRSQPTTPSAALFRIVQRVRRDGAFLLAIAAAIGGGSEAATPPIRSTHYDGSAAEIVEFGSDASLDPEVNMTVEGWVHPETVSGFPTIVGHNYLSSYWFGLANGKLRFYRGGGIRADSVGVVPSGKWTHVAASYDGKAVAFYINGQPAGTAPLANSGAGRTETLSVGGDGGAFPFQGYLDEVRIWRGARTEAQIQGSRFKEAGAEGDLLFLAADGGAGAARGAVFGILPRDLRIPEAGGPVIVDGNVDTATEYAGSEQWVLLYPDAPSLPDGVAHLVIRNVAGDQRLYVGISQVRDVGPNWQRSDSWIALHVDPDHSRDALAQPGDFQIQAPLDGAAARWLWGDGNGGYAPPNAPPDAGLWPVAYSYFCSGEFSPPCVEFGVDAALLGGFPASDGLALAHYWVAAVGNDYLAPGDAGWNAPVTWAGAEYLTTAPPTTAAIGGTIRDEQGTGLPAVLVTLKRGVQVMSSTTDEQGYYLFTGLASGAAYEVSPYAAGLDFDPPSVLVAPLEEDRVVDFTAKPKPGGEPRIVAPQKPGTLGIRLDQVAYAPTDDVTVVLDLVDYPPHPAAPAIFLVAKRSGDVERPVLAPTSESGLFVTEAPVPLAPSAGSVQPFDGRLDVLPGDRVVALYYTDELRAGHPEMEEDMVFDLAVVLDPDFAGAPVAVLPDLALTDDERVIPAGENASARCWVTEVNHSRSRSRNWLCTRAATAS